MVCCSLERFRIKRLLPVKKKWKKRTKKREKKFTYSRLAFANKNIYENVVMKRSFLPGSSYPCLMPIRQLYLSMDLTGCCHVFSGILWSLHQQPLNTKCRRRGQPEKYFLLKTTRVRWKVTVDGKYVLCMNGIPIFKYAVFLWQKIGVLNNVISRLHWWL